MQLKSGQTVVKAEQPSTIIAEDDDIDSIIQLAPTDSDTELSDSEQAQQQQQQNQIQQKTTSISVQGTKQLLNIAAPPIIRQLTTKQGTLVGTKLNTSGGDAVKPQTGSTVISLLSVPEICRQLYELRRQNDDLKRKFDAAQKEKEEMRQRLDRLEELLLVEKTDDGYVDT